MPLSEVRYERTPIHTRQVTCHGYRRPDGLWDIEGRIVDTKSYPFENVDRGLIEVGDPLHDMSLRLTITSSYEIKAVEAVTDKAPYRICPAITPNFQRLVGLKIGPGFTRKVRQLLGGVEGCTHLVELLGPMATTAIQTLAPILAREHAANDKDPVPAVGARSDGKPGLLGTCHAYAPTSPIVARLWPEHARQEGETG